MIRDFWSRHKYYQEQVPQVLKALWHLVLVVLYRIESWAWTPCFGFKRWTQNKLVLLKARIVWSSNHNADNNDYSIYMFSFLGHDCIYLETVVRNKHSNEGKLSAFLYFDLNTKVRPWHVRQTFQICNAAQFSIFMRFNYVWMSVKSSYIFYFL